MTAVVGSPVAESSSGLACFGVSGWDTRLYYLTSGDPNSFGDVAELAWQGHWVNRALWVIGQPTNPVPNPASGLGSNSNYILFSGCKPLNGLSVTICVTQDIVCKSASGSTSGFGFQLNAYSPKGVTWVGMDMTAAAGSAVAESGSALTCFGVNGSATRLYYLDPNNHVNELAWNNGWSNTDTTAAAGSPVAASGSALACFGVNGSATRLYYLDASNHVNELAWNNGWSNTDMTAAAGSSVAASGSALACFGVNGSATRLYYLDASNHVNELVWNNGWSNTDMTAAAGSPGAASGSALACFGGTAAPRAFITWTQTTTSTNWPGTTDGATQI